MLCRCFLQKETTRSLYDNFLRKGYTETQVHCEVSGATGQTIAGQVWDRIHNNHLDRVRHPLGSHFYGQVRDQYPLSGSDSLPPLPAGIAGNAALLASMSASGSALLRNREHIISIIETVRAPNMVDAIKASEFFLKLNPKLASHKTTSVRMVNWFAEVKLKEMFPECHGAVWDQCDQVLCEAFSKIIKILILNS